MKREELHNGYVRLTYKDGILDTRTKIVYPEVVCKAEDEHFFRANIKR